MIKGRGKIGGSQEGRKGQSDMLDYRKKKIFHVSNKPTDIAIQL